MSERYVNLSESTAAISGTQSYRLRVNYPATGGVQFVDATGAVINPASAIPTASLIPATDATYDLGAVGTRWRIGYFSGSVMTPVLAARVGGVSTQVATLVADVAAVNVIALASSATTFTPSISADGTDTNVSLRLFGKGAGGIQIRNAANDATVFGVQNVSSTFFGVAMQNAGANVAGGSVTIDGVAGRFRLATGVAGPFTITNNRVLSAASIVLLMPRSINATTTRVVATAGVGSFSVTLDAAPTVTDLDVDFIVINPAT